MDPYLLLKEYICNNKIDDIVSLVQNSTLSNELIAWLVDFVEKTDCVNNRNTAAIALADLKCEQAVPVLVKLVKKFCRTNSYAALLYALSLLDCREYINDIYPLIYDGNFEARHIVFDILSNNLRRLPDNARNQISEKIKCYLEDCNDKHELLVNTLELFENAIHFDKPDKGELMRELGKIVSSKNLIDTAWSYFWRNYDSYLTEYPDEAAEYSLTGRSSICPALDSICYKHFMESDNEYIIVRVNIHNQNAQYLGYYDACFSEFGEMEDDFFVIE